MQLWRVAVRRGRTGAAGRARRPTRVRTLYRALLRLRLRLRLRLLLLRLRAPIAIGAIAEKRLLLLVLTVVIMSLLQGRPIPVSGRLLLVHWIQMVTALRKYRTSLTATRFLSFLRLMTAPLHLRPHFTLLVRRGTLFLDDLGLGAAALCLIGICLGRLGNHIMRGCHLRLAIGLARLALTGLLGRLLGRTRAQQALTRAGAAETRLGVKLLLLANQRWVIARKKEQKLNYQLF